MFLFIYMFQVCVMSIIMLTHFAHDVLIITSTLFVVHRSFYLIKPFGSKYNP